MAENELRRRTVLAAAGTGLVGSLSGCSTILGDDSSGSDSSPPPDPTIEEVTAEVQNFRQTQEHSTTYILLANNGGLGELKLTIKAKGEAAIYTEDKQVFSLEAGQELQTRFELFTHEGAKELVVEIQATAKPENSDTYIVSEEKTPDDIDYSANTDSA
ncbi:hypothetical protein [Halosimplex pelagicum]|uniref:Uncharacterized protein n=1 Tax=Halosimplex pelagicum TaxID=869886 RepID=A0A7D5SVC6_9EURY|nr:hypothetical protein [Halosimplex pelagicum]QLH82167.1 hypothetical protein HZS54_11365 [Halosimplex pelagicum]